MLAGTTLLMITAGGALLTGGAVGLLHAVRSRGGGFFSLALLFDGLGLIALGVGGRCVVHPVSEDDSPHRSLKDERGSQEQSPKRPRHTYAIKTRR